MASPKQLITDYRHLAGLILALFILITLNSVLLSADTYQYLLLLLVFVFGFPHGALDIIMLERFSADPNASMRFGKRVRHYGLYTVCVLLSVLLWVTLPNLSLVLFLAFAIVHFRKDWQSLGPTPFTFSMATIFVCGGALEYNAILAALFQLLGVSNEFVINLLDVMKLAVLVSISAIVLGWFVRYFSHSQLLIALGSLGIVYLVPPLTVFVAYFSFYHAIIHTKKIIYANKLSLKRFVLWLALPMILTLVFICLFFINTAVSTAVFERWFYVVFIALFALTIPHILLSKLHELKFKN
jgi:Brp/Blh family beta-carotene 15,15'-monooxygenase